MVKKNITLEDLAMMVKHGFDEVYKRFDSTDARIDSTDARIDSIDEGIESIDERIDSIDERLDITRKEMNESFFAVNRRLDLLHEDISDLPAIREELKDHDERLVRVERKIGSSR